MDDKAQGGDIEGKSHKEGGVPLIDERTGKQVAEVEGGEFLNCKDAMNDPTIRTFTGTNKEIVSQVNLTAQCNPSDDYKQKNENIMENGGNINVVNFSEESDMPKGGDVEADDNIWVSHILTKEGSLIAERHKKEPTNEELYQKYKKQGYTVVKSDIYKIGNINVIDTFIDALNVYVKEKYGSELDREHTIVSYDMIGDKAIIKVAMVTLKSGQEVTVFPAELVSSNMQKGGDVDKSEFAKAILSQLGGRRFIVMTGAKDFAYDYENKYITFRIGRNSSDANYVRISLTPMDTYDMEFIRIRGGDMTVLKKHEGIYYDQLQPIFTEFTGMDTHFSKGGDVKSGQYKIQYPKKGQLPDKFGEALDMLRNVGSDLWIKKTPQYKRFYKVFQDLSNIYTRRDIQGMEQGGDVKKPKFKYNVGQEGMFNGEEVEILGLKYSPPLYAIGESGELFDANIRKISQKVFEDDFSPFSTKLKKPITKPKALDIDIDNPDEAIKKLKAELKGLKTPNMAEGGEVDYTKGKIFYKKGDELYYYDVDEDTKNRTLTKGKIKMIVSDEKGWERYLVEILEGYKSGQKKIVKQTKLFKKGKAKPESKAKSKSKAKGKSKVKSIGIDNPDKEISKLKKELINLLTKEN